MTNENFEAACAHDTDSWFDRRTMLRIGAAGAAAAAVVGDACVGLDAMASRKSSRADAFNSPGLLQMAPME